MLQQVYQYFVEYIHYTILYIMTLYKINIDNRNYESWNIFNANTLELIILEEFNPIQHKLFNNDVFTYNQGQVDIIHSSIRINENIPAVLILENNKTYGRENKDNVYIKYLDGTDEETICLDRFYNEFKLAYALTVHKSQGSEYKYIVISMLFEYYIL